MKGWKNLFFLKKRRTSSTPAYAVALFKSEGITSLNISVFIVDARLISSILSVFEGNQALGKPTLINLWAEENEWEKISGGGFWVFMEVVVLLCCVTFFLIALRGLILFVREEGFNLSLPQVLHSTNMLACFLLSMAVFDPWGVRFISTGSFSLAMLKLSNPPFLTSITFLSFFFVEVLTAKGYIPPQLDKFKYLFLFACLTFWVLYLVNVVFTFLNQNNIQTIRAVSTLNVVLYSIVLLFFITTAILILLRLRKQKSKTLKRILVLSSFIVLGLIVYLVGASLNLSQTFGIFTPQTTLAVWTLIWFGFCLMVGPQVIFFREPNLYSNSSKNSDRKKESSHRKGTSNTLNHETFQSEGVSVIELHNSASEK